MIAKTIAILLLWIVPASAQTYSPQPGDIIVSTNPDPEVQAKYRAVNAGPPTHAAIVAPVLKDGELRLVLLESLIETGVIASDFSVLGEPSCTDIYVRKLNRPLTPSEIDRLTLWATQQLGKPYPRMSQVYIAAALGKPTSKLHLRPRFNVRALSCSRLVAVAVGVTGRAPAAHIRTKNVMPIDFVTQELHLHEWSEPERIK